MGLFRKEFLPLAYDLAEFSILKINHEWESFCSLQGNFLGRPEESPEFENWKGWDSPSSWERDMIPAKKLKMKTEPQGITWTI